MVQWCYKHVSTAVSTLGFEFFLKRVFRVAGFRTPLDHSLHVRHLRVEQLRFHRLRNQRDGNAGRSDIGCILSLSADLTLRSELQRHGKAGLK